MWSAVYGPTGIEFVGWDPTTSALLAEVEIAEEPEWGIRQDDVGTHSFGRSSTRTREGEVV